MAHTGRLSEEQARFVIASRAMDRAADPELLLAARFVSAEVVSLREALAARERTLTVIHNKAQHALDGDMSLIDAHEIAALAGAVVEGAAE